MNNIQHFLSAIVKSTLNNTFVSISLGNYKGTEENLKNIYIKRILIKKEEKLSFTYRYKTKDIVKNYDIKEGIEKIQNALNEGFKIATLFTTNQDICIENTKDKGFILKEKPATKTELPSLSHDKDKKRIITAQGKKYLYELKITDEAGNVFKTTQDKYRQINHYIEILASLIKEMPTQTAYNVVDMGSGKGYLTFALYDYLQNVLKVSTQVTGVEFRKDLVEICNKIALNSEFEGLHFEQGTIESYENQDINILIALHACDTATDDAIAKGLQANAELIVVAPCCHKQIRREMEKNKVTNDIDFLTQYGIFLERQAEMVTDGIRAMILEYFGYKTKVFEFISDAHTPKNVMIVGIKQAKQNKKNPALLEKIQAAKAYFGITYHHLEKIILE